MKLRTATEWRKVKKVTDAYLSFYAEQIHPGITDLFRQIFCLRAMYFSAIRATFWYYFPS